MRLVFVSNYLTHHQLPMCEAFQKLLGEEEFHFVSTMPMEEERSQMGWQLSGKYNFEIQAYRSEEQEELAKQMICQADVIITGAISVQWCHHCVKQNAVCFVYSERLFKSGYINALRPGYFRHSLRYHRYAARKKVYSLCASAYLSGDYRILQEYKNRCFQWGYFPETVTYENIEETIQRKQPGTMLWVGRFIEYKHPEMAVEAVQRLLLDGYDVKLRFVGDGPLAEQLKAQADRAGIADRIVFTGNMPFEQVRKEMEQASILLATSDFNEGWGAVINEGMNAGCAVVASHAMGSVPYLIEDGKNGMIFPSGNGEVLYNELKTLLDTPEEVRKMGRNAYRTIVTQWNAMDAAKRLLRLAEDLDSGGQGNLFESGPCSKAPVLWNGWMK